MSEIANIDKFGRILIPKKIRKELGLENSVVSIEKKENAILITLVKKKTKNIVQKISEMNLPISDWEEMEKDAMKVD